MILPLTAPAAMVGLYFTPKDVFGCANRGLMALGVVFLATVAAAATMRRAMKEKRGGGKEAAYWWIASTLILLLPIVLLAGPLG